MNFLVKAAIRWFVIFVLIGVAFGASAQDAAANKTIAPEERQALIALYNGTGGAQWKDKSGWLGAPGTECAWHGVECGYPGHMGNEVPFVSSLNLSENNLAGAIPAELGQLKNLEWLYLFGNPLTGMLPQPLIQRWLAGPLWIAAEAPLLTPISKIDYERGSTSVLCVRQRVILGSDQTATVYTTRCRKATPRDRTEYCEVKEGEITWSEFAMLAWTIEREGFFALQPQYSRNVTDVGIENTRVTRNGMTKEVSNYASGGPLQLWTIAAAIEGVASDIELKRTTRRATCPAWELK